MHSQYDAVGNTPVNRPDEWRAVARVLRSPAGPTQHTLLRAAHSLLDDLVTTIFPTDCRLCNGPLTSAQHSAVCDRCLARILPQSVPLCTRCGEALAPEAVRSILISRYADLASLCPGCRMASPDFERAVAYGLYEDELRESIHLLKYNHVRSLARPLGAMLGAAVLALEDAAANDLLVIPVPLYRAKQHERGYDQSTLLAEAMIRHLRMQQPRWQLILRTNILERTRNTRSQFGLMPHQRRKNLRGAFRVCDAKAIAGREVLLVDDIFTTGATARECARILRRAGAAKVWVATVARAQRQDRVVAWDNTPRRDLSLN